MLVIAINGIKRSGKDTVADYLIEHYGNASKVKFASMIKELFMKSYNKYHVHHTINYDDVDGATDFDREEVIDNILLNPEEVFVDFIYSLDKLVTDFQRGLRSKVIEFDNIKAIIEANRLIEANKSFSVRTYLEFLGTEIAKVSDSYIWAKLTFIETINSNTDVVVIPDLRFEEELNYFEDNKIDIVDFIKLKISKDVNYEPTHISDKSLPDEVFDYVITNDGHLEDLYDKIDIILEKIGK